MATGTTKCSVDDSQSPVRGVCMMTKATLDVSVIICAYTEARWHDLVAAVESLHRQSRPPHEIIVVVDHNQLLLERARTELSDVVVENSEPQGLSGARN